MGTEEEGASVDEKAEAKFVKDCIQSKLSSSQLRPAKQTALLNMVC